MRFRHGRRGRFEIVAEVLEQTGKPVKKTQIMRECNLSYNQLKRYMNLMKSNGLLKRKKNSEATTYNRTGKGLRFLTVYKDIVRLLHS